MSNISDFSRESINKAVKEAIVFHPLTLLFIAVGFFGLVGIFLFGTSLYTLIPLISGFVIGGAVVGINFSRKNSFEDNYLTKLKEKLLEQNKKKLLDVEVELEDWVRKSEGNDDVKRANKQFQKVQKKFDTFHSILDNKLQRSELTYGRFYQAAEQVYGAVLDNIEKMMLSFATIDSIDIDDLDDRAEELEERKKDAALSVNDAEELESIEKSTDLYQKKLEDVDTLLTLNQKALTELDITIHTLQNTKTKQGRANQDFDSTLSDLTMLAERTSKYAVR